jgi:ABC-2 type transport system ATP-binding protein
MSAALEFHGITKDYRGGFRRKRFRALDDFSLSVHSGEVFGFLGPNGAGKTTALHIALGLMSPTAGSGVMLGQPFGHARTRRRVGFLAENVAYYNRPARDLIRFYGRLNGVNGIELNRRMKELLEVLDLAEVKDKPANKFSRGMLQKVGLAQALINDPELLILDEPTSALDPAARVQVREMLLAARRAGKTIFLSSHLLSEIEMVCDRIAILHRGRLVRMGTVAELLESKSESVIMARNLGRDELGGELVAQDMWRFRVPAERQRATIERIWAAGGEIVSIAGVRKSLEELFLELTGAENPEESNSR